MSDEIKGFVDEAIVQLNAGKGRLSVEDVRANIINTLNNKLAEIDKCRETAAIQLKIGYYETALENMSRVKVLEEVIKDLCWNT